MAWLEIHQEVVRHRKTKRLARLLGVGRPQAVGHLIFLWTWAFDYAPSGDLSAFEGVEIAEESGWEGDPETFVSALQSSGYMDGDMEHWYLHDWEVYAGRLLTKRAANAQRARDARQRKPDGVRNVDAAYGATRPDPTVPDQDLIPPASVPSAANGTANSGQVPDRWPFFLGRLAMQDRAWLKVNLGACRRIASETSEAAVTTALSFAHENPPDINGSAYGWLRATATRVHSGEVFA
jgi:hypothetical protein